jgi:hypothetical protein
MIKVKNNGVRNAAVGALVVGAAVALSKTTSADSMGSKNPLNPGACPDGRCPSGRFGLSSIGNMAKGLVGSLWNTLLCGPGAVPADPRAKNRVDMSALWLRSTGCSAADILKLIKVKDGKIRLNRKELDDRLSAAMGQSVNTLKAGATAALVAGLAAATGKDEATVAMAVGETVTILDNSKVNDAQTLTELLKVVSGSESIARMLDMEAEFAILDMILDKAIELGIPQAFDIIMGKIEDDKMRRRLILERLRQSAIMSELALVRKAIEQVGSAGALARVPDLVRLITYNYTWGRNVTPAMYPAKRDELLLTLNMADPNWDKTYRNGVLVSNIEPFAVASDRALTLFKMSEHKYKAMFAPKYETVSVRTLARRNYPRVALSY